MLVEGSRPGRGIVKPLFTPERIAALNAKKKAAKAALAKPVAVQPVEPNQAA